jgi:uncharacterized protein YjbI with pentapeptide repeats
LFCANLEGAHLEDADLTGIDAVDLIGLKLTGARYNSRTRWPAGFDPLKHGALLEK